ncbi:MAG: 3'(2'),5'-bisphosphate nucleotidase CysQ [Xanthomonadales bacterium]|jgi:3'(2'), 5'-bisphosphate nucleotidase|nr:3'(2'),5'-bisphosphate nucleotidase CysQ [Xanthomonadales bacterium]MBP6078966.1 3'(2'),5'-bisphosphate nucleotidase CysQ [Xanthomonadales bacterium]MBP7622932.1 3'(2'),5'-bisphosphate nucleotidase CysQ [Xanthomonadales bacterium]
MMVATQQLLEALRTLAKDAAAAIMAVYQQDFDVTRKDDRSPLTAADLASHRILVDGLRALTPEIPVLSEECADLDVTERRGWDRYWCVDPLDGTREFVKRNGEFCICIALIEEGAPTIGLVHAPVTGRCHYAARGMGAFVAAADGTTHGLRASHPAASWRVAGSRSHGDARSDGVLAKLGPNEHRPMGSALKFGLIAEAAADLYLRFGPTSEWDTAAGQCIVEEAGGAVLDLHGQPLRYNQRDSILNPDFVAFGALDATQRAQLFGALA